jgi:hypothetical protein
LGLGIARPTVERFVEHARRLNEQGADWLSIDEYVQRRCKWIRVGIDAMLGEKRILNVFTGVPLALPVPGSDMRQNSRPTDALAWLVNGVVQASLQKHWQSQWHTEKASSPVPPCRLL